jgi:hypothetical protein
VEPSFTISCSKETLLGASIGFFPISKFRGVFGSYGVVTARAILEGQYPWLLLPVHNEGIQQPADDQRID